MSVFFFLLLLFLDLQGVAVFIWWEISYASLTHSSNVISQSVRTGSRYVLNTCFLSCTSSVRTQMCIHAPRTQFGLKREPSFGPRLNNCALVFNVRVMLSVRCDVHVLHLNEDRLWLWHVLHMCFGCSCTVLTFHRRQIEPLESPVKTRKKQRKTPL